MRITIFIFLLFGALSAQAQPKFNSPYSRFGLGEIADPNFAALNGMGNISAAYQDGNNLNMVNPASLTSLQLTAFEIGVDMRNSKWSSATKSDEFWSGNLSHLAIGFPLRNKSTEILEGKKRDWRLGMGLRLAPKSNVGYDIEVNGPVAGIDSSTYTFEGTGGIYGLTWGNAFAYKNLSLGVNLEFLFGSIANESRANPDGNLNYDFVQKNSFSNKGLLFNLGAQYVLDLPDAEAERNEKPSSKHIIFGATFGPNQKYKTELTDVIYRERLGTSVPRDTFQNIENRAGIAKYPMEIGIGAHYVIDRKLKVGVNFTSTKWSNYSNDAKPETLQDASTLSVGGEFLPEFRNYTSYFQRVRYRAGLVYRKDYRSILNSSLTNTGITFGFGLPVILPKRQISFVNLGFELGKFGTDAALSESYFKIALGFTLNDSSWFFKRKFN